MTYTHIKRTLLLISCIMGLASSILQAKYISGLLSEEAAGLTSGTDNLVTVDGILDGTSLATLSGDIPTTNSVSNLISDGFASLQVGKFTAASGAIVAAFNESAPAEADGGYVTLDDTTIAGGSALYQTDDKFLPGAIIKVGSNYNVLGSVRKNIGTGTNKSKMFLSQIVASTGAFNTSLNTGGSIDLTDSVFTGAYGGGVNNNAQFTINAAVTDGTLIYVVGSILDDSSSTGTANKKKAFVGTITASTGVWVTQTSLAGVTYSSPNWSQSTASSPKAIIVSDASADVELLGLALNGSNLYVCGYHGAASKGAIVMHFGISLGKLTLDTTTFPSTGVYNYGTTGTKAWDIKYALDSFASTGDLVLAISNPLTSLDPLQQSVTAVAITNTGTVVAGFGSSGTTHTFSGIPSAYPHDFSLNYPEFSFANTYLTLQIDGSNNIYISGSLSAYGMPFVYKLSSAGVEQPFAPNFRYGIDTGNLTSAIIDASSVLYPVMGYGWDTSLQGLFASVIDSSNDQLYLFGCNASVQRTVSSGTFTLTSSSDTVQQVPTGNLSVALDPSQDSNSPLLSYGYITTNLAITNFIDNLNNKVYVSLTASTLDDTTAVGETLSNLVISGSLNTASTGSSTITIYGTVQDSNGIIIPLTGSYDVTINATTRNVTAGTSDYYVRGNYAGGVIEIQLQDSVTPSNQVLSTDLNTITANLDFDYTLITNPSITSTNTRIVVTNTTLGGPTYNSATGTTLALSAANTLVIPDIILSVGDNYIPATASVTLDGTYGINAGGTDIIASGLLTVTLDINGTLTAISGTLSTPVTADDSDSSSQIITITPTLGTETITPAAVTGYISLAVANSAAANSCSVSYLTGALSSAHSNTTGATIGSLTTALTALSSTVFTKKGQHSILVQGTIPVTITGSSISSVSVKGYMSIIVDNSYNVRALPFILSGQSPNALTDIDDEALSTTQPITFNFLILPTVT